VARRSRKIIRENAPISRKDRHFPGILGSQATIPGRMVEKATPSWRNKIISGATWRKYPSN
jgi:hypothetical protein